MLQKVKFAPGFNKQVTSTGAEGQLSYLAIYPNPLNDVLYVDGDYDAVQIFDILGKSLLNSSERLQLSLPQFSFCNAQIFNLSLLY